MKFYFAPMEGVTGYLYRNAHHSLFEGVDKYFTPFISPNQNKSFKTREMNDIQPDNNKGVPVVPQILTNNADDFIVTCKKMMDLGYEEINLNLGCPSGTVVAKKKGSGFLYETDDLDRFLEKIFDADLAKISIKTRIGKYEPDEFEEILRIYNQYPIEELTIHPRVQKDYYKNKPHLDVFRYAVEHSKIKLCYNGDIFTKQDYDEFVKAFPTIDSIMIGRGLLANPGLIYEIKEGKTLDKNTVRALHDTVYASYQIELSGDKNLLFKMKEFWCYLHCVFTNNEKYWKKIRKAQKLRDYNEIVDKLFHEESIVPGAGFQPKI